MRRVRFKTARGFRSDGGRVSRVAPADPVLKVKSEHLEQAEFVSWFRKTFPEVRIFAIPNGESRSISSASRLKVEGVSAGVPDLFVPEWLLWVEMKRSQGGRVSREQKSWIDYLNIIGHCAIVCAGCSDARDKVMKFVEKGQIP